MTFSQSAMLVSLNVRSYGAKKEDKKITAEVAQQHGATTDVGRYTKQLVLKDQLEPITKAVTALRQFHYDNTLPWLDEGVRILPSGNYQEYKAAMSGLQDDYDSAVRAFVSDWPDIIAQARARLNGMFNVADYPVDIRARFGCAVRYMPVPDANDFRVSIADNERAELQRQIEETLSDASQAAMRDLWERVTVCVSAMAERLKAFKVVQSGGKIKTENAFRDSLVENLRDLCALIPRLNFAGDSRLEAVRQQIEAELLACDAQDLRNDHVTRGSVAASAERIAASMAEFMV